MKTLLAVLALLCISASPQLISSPADAPDVPGPVTIDVIAVGDTLTYRIGWGPGARATSYDVVVTASATNGTWSVPRDSTNCNVDANCGHVPGQGMGIVLNTSGLYRKTWLTAPTWDSVTFTASVASRNASGLSSAVTASRRAIRLPGPPGPVTIDSALQVVGLQLLRPAGSILPDSLMPICAVVRFGNGAVAMRTPEPCVPGLYEALPVAQRVVTPAQQARADSICLVWSTPNTPSDGGMVDPEVCVASPALLERRGLIFRVAVR